MTPDSKSAPTGPTLHPMIVIFGGFAVAAIGSDLRPVEAGLPIQTAVQPTGQLILVTGAAVLVVADVAMVRSGTTIDPRRDTTRIVTTGIFRFSRNPIYLGWFLVMIGAGLEKLSLFYVAVSIVMVLVLQRFVVIPEEWYVAESLGDESSRYRSQVRRWL
jgi:protein-S-isoprenylcysteine O-methyltransferase Ste14